MGGWSKSEGMERNPKTTNLVDDYLVLSNN